MITSHDELKFQPGWKFVFSHPAHFFSFGFGAGLFPRSPAPPVRLLRFLCIGIWHPVCRKHYL